MRELKDNLFYQKKGIALYLGDSLELLKSFESKSVDMIFADPPYFLSSDGISFQNGKVVSVNKGEWDKTIPLKEKHSFNRDWIKLCKEILKDNGTIWISGTFHNLYSVGMALEQEGFKILNNIIWEKTNPPPNISCRVFTHSTETIIWSKKDFKNSKYKFNYLKMKEINEDKQMKDVWKNLKLRTSEKKFGKHPTQKPLELLERIILASTEEGDVILDPFNGSGTTGVMANLLNRNYIGIEKEIEYLELSKKRFEELKDNEILIKE